MNFDLNKRIEEAKAIDLKAKSEEIDENFARLKEELQESRNKYIKLLGKATKEYHDAAAGGDLRENAAFHKAVEDMATYTREITAIDNKIKAADACDLNNYAPIGMVVMFTTVCILSLDDGNIYTYKVFPKGIASTEHGVLDEATKVCKAIWKKSEGFEFTIDHRVSRERLRYRIIGLY